MNFIEIFKFTPEMCVCACV